VELRRRHAPQHAGATTGHTYLRTGTFTATVRVVDGANQTATASRTVTVRKM
jgi:hypothetical protein